jgi:hypothetical protein
MKSHPARVEAKDKEHSFDQVGLSGSIGTNHTRKIAVKDSDLLLACIGFKILQNHVVDDQSRLLFPDDIQIDGLIEHH